MVLAELYPEAALRMVAYSPRGTLQFPMGALNECTYVGHCGSLAGLSTGPTRQRSVTRVLICVYWAPRMHVCGFRCVMR